MWAFHKDIDDQTRANSDSPLAPDRNATQFVTSRLMLRREKQWASRYFATGVWGTDITPTALWSNYATSTPLLDVETGRGAVLARTGFEPNTLVLGYNVFAALKNHPTLVDRIKYTSDQSLTAALMARMFEVDRVLVAKAVVATNNEGETAAYSFTHGKHALLAYVNPTPAPEMPSAGYTFAWKGVGGQMGTTIGVNSFRLEALKSDRIEAEIAFDDKVVSADLGYFFESVVA